MDKNVKTALLIAAGGLGVYLLYKYAEKEGLLIKWGLVSGPKPAVTGGAGGGAPTGGGTGTGTGTNTGGGAAPPPVAVDPYHPPATNPPPVSNPPAQQTTLQKVQAAAVAGGYPAGTLLNADQWCYFAAQVGVTCPDPGDIDASVYEGAWFGPADRTTPIDVGTWWELMKYASPGLSGLPAAGLGLLGWLT